MELNKLAKQIHGQAISKGFWDEDVVNGKIIPRSKGDQFSNFHSEISEVWEEYRNGHEMNEIYFGINEKPEGVPIELADCIIRILDTCEAYGIDIENAIKIKMEYNSGRPHRHGGKLA